MAKNRDFFDYVSLGAQLSQAASAGAIRDQLSALSQIEAEKLSAANREKAVQSQEDKIRDFVFNSTQLIADMTEAGAPVDDPCRTLVILYEIQRYAAEFNVTTAGVRAYADKDRVHQLLATLKRLTIECEGRIDAVERQQAELCATYKAEQSEMGEVIRFAELQAAVQNQRLEIPKLETRLAAERSTGRVVPLPVSLSVLFLGLGMFVVAIIASIADANTVFCVTLLLGLIIAPLGCLIVFGKTTVGRATCVALENRIRDEKHKLAEREFTLRSDERFNVLRKKFGVHDVEGYHRMAAERKALIGNVMKHEVGSVPNSINGGPHEN